jgi:ribulose-5-phosphate 4-epimerase/fuculose-1-phosphate aldolase
MATVEQDARAAIVAAGVRLGARGLVVAAEGNISVRLDEGILITPSGRRKDALVPEDLVLVGFEKPIGDGATAFDTALAGPRPSSDIAIHRAIYQARPDVRAIVHAHLAAALALTIVGIRPDPQALPETALFLPRLPFVSFAAPGSDLLATKIVAALTDGQEAADYATAALLERHGAIAVGPDLIVAGDRLELADLLCRVYRDTTLLRSALKNGGR